MYIVTFDFKSEHWLIVKLWVFLFLMVCAWHTMWCLFVYLYTTISYKVIMLILQY